MIARHMLTPAAHVAGCEFGHVPIAMLMPSGNATNRSNRMRSRMATFFIQPLSLSDEVPLGSVSLAIGRARQLKRTDSMA